MNCVARGFLEFVVDMLERLEDNVDAYDEVWIGFFRPQYQLTNDQRFVTKIVAIGARVTLEYLLDRDSEESE